MPVPERRRTPRIALDRLAYIKIEPNNGGIVLNVSEGGLCFHSIVSVEPGSLRFSLLDQNRHIDADGELAWMDEQQKVGGIRFTALSPQAREQIQNLISRPYEAVHDEETEIPPSGTRFPSLAERWSASAPATVAVPSREQIPAYRRLHLLKGFSGGLATGLLIAFLVASGFLFHSHRHQVGESLIHLGQRLSATPSPQQQAQTSGVLAEPRHAARPPIPGPKPAPAPTLAAAREKPLAQTRPSAPEIQAEQARPVAQPAATITVARGGRVAPAAEAVTLAPPSIPSSNAFSMPKLLADKNNALPQLVTVSESPGKAAETEPAPPMFFEVGKFKQQWRAREVNDQLAQLRFPASITQKNSLFGSSYYVLVGPYEDPEAADDAHQSLASSGFKPRAFERGSRNFTLSSGVTLNGTDMSGDYVISWESYIPDAKVKFSQNDSVVASADGKWVDRGVRNNRNAFVYLRRGDGSHVLLEIRFEGMSKVLVFSRPS